MERFKKRFGFDRSEVTLDNWKDSPYSTWSLHHASELIPVADVEGSASATAIFVREIDAALLNLTFEAGGQSERILEFLLRSHTDALLVLHKGRVVSEYFAKTMEPTSRHLIFSISKSITGLLAGAVMASFDLNPDSQVSCYIPEAKKGAYSDCTVRDLLDMLVSVEFDEIYAEKDGPYARYRRSMLWMPAIPGDQYFRENLASSILSLPKAGGAHGTMFSYRSPNSDLLGLVLEKVSGIRYPELLSNLLWQPIGASPATVTVDAVGMSRAAGGISCTAHDLGLVGELMRSGGVANGKQVIPEDWIADTMQGGDPKAWKAGDFVGLLPRGRYRNQWYAVGDGSYCGIGIHGQWLYVNPDCDTVIVKMSSQSIADDDELDARTLQLFNAISQYLS